ncbi:hypothetical protein ACIGDM_00965 [Rothia koreensis]|uniref:hypothetical protein n=1 Tax=Rothia koreensis TaxID=592378 RepID=UPI0037CC776A
MTAQTQCVAANEESVYELADLVRTTLTNHPVGDGVILPDTNQQASARILVDGSVTPARPYLPLHWTLTTQ